MKRLKKQQQRRAKHESDKNIHERAERWIEASYFICVHSSLKQTCWLLL